MTFKRRDFLRMAGLGLGAMAAGPALMTRLARAAEEQDRYVVFLYFEGGWDTMLCLDPRDPTVFHDGQVAETGIQPAYSRIPASLPHAPMDAGPYMLGPCAYELAPLADHVAVINGLNMATLTHEVGRRYMITGKAPSGLQARGNSVATLAAAGLEHDTDVPHLAFRMESYNVDQPSHATAMGVSFVQHMFFILQDALGAPTGLSPSVMQAVEGYRAAKAGSRRGPLTQVYAANVAQAGALVSSGLHTQFDFNASIHDATRAHYGFSAATQEGPFGRAAMAATAIKSGLSRVVSLAICNDLDTHDQTWATNHPVILSNAFSATARLITDLRDTEAPGGGSYLDRTTIVGFSEFGRTAKLNNRNGRDHNLCSSAFIAGAGINGGQVVGASNDSAMGPRLIDLATGAASESGQSLKPEHVMTTAMQAAGLDAGPLAALPIQALLA